MLYFLTGSSGNILSGTTGHSVILGTSEEKKEEPVEKAFNLNERQKLDLLLAILKLKLLNNEEQKLQYAEKITKIDKFIADAGNDKLSGGWNALTACLATESCTDEFYIFMKMITETSQTKKGLFSWGKTELPSPLLKNILELKQAAEKNNIVIRSKLVTETNAQILVKGSIELKEVWEKLVECNFTCDEYDKLLLMIVESYFEKE